VPVSPFYLATYKRHQILRKSYKGMMRDYIFTR
jgi:hypothetical protein